MLAKTYSAALLGLDAQLIEVEVDISGGLHSFNIVGLPDSAVKESKDRVSSAIKNLGAKSPLRFNRRITINLAPADFKKEGSCYDLAIAIGYLLASEQIMPFDNTDKIFSGELSLDGKLRPIPGALSMAVLAEHNPQIRYLFVPKANYLEARIYAKRVKIIGVDSLQALILHLENKEIIQEEILPDNYFLNRQDKNTFSMLGLIKSQEKAKRALMISAAGGHNLLMVGPPGSGKTMLAKALPEILPKLNLEEALEITRIYSASKMLNTHNPLICIRPFRAPHHTASSVALVGGGTNPQPGEISLAHRGVLFLDELPEFQKSVLENLRQPLEEGEITVARAQARITFPAKFILIAAMNPCPCGYFGDLKKECRCSPNEILKYRKKISGPLLDRIDMQIEVPRLSYEKIRNNKNTDQINIEGLKQKISLAREIQIKRLENSEYKNRIYTNSEMGPLEIETFCKLNEESEKIVKNAIENFSLSVRSFHRLLKVSRTIADLDGSLEIKTAHLAEALQYKTGLEFDI